MSQAVLKACEATIKPHLQKYLTTLILSPISSNSDLHHHCFTLIHQLYHAVPQVLLPVIPHLTHELQADEGSKRLEAVQLLGQLFGVPGNKLVCDYAEVLEALLARYQDTQVNVRTAMLEFTPTLVAGAGSEGLQQKVLKAAAERLQDYDEKVRIAAVKYTCQTVRQLLVGPSAAAAACKPNKLLLPPPTMDLLGSLGSQEEDAAAAAELGVPYTLPEFVADQKAAAGSALQPNVKDLQYVQEILQKVTLRLRDMKVAVRKAAVNNLLAVFRTVAAAGDNAQLARCCWLPTRIFLCSKSDSEMRTQIVEVAMRDGLLGSQAQPAQAAATWVQVWLAALPLERDALMALISLRARLQGDALVYLALRRKLSAKAKDKEDNIEAVQEDLERAARQLAKQMPQPDRAAEGLTALQSVRDNHAFAALQRALAPDGTPQAASAACADAISRVGSRSPAGELVGQLLLWARPALWLPPPLLSALLDLAAQDPDGQQGELVVGAYQLLHRMSTAASMLFAGLLPRLHSLLASSELDLQQLGAQLLAQCAWQLRKRGMVLTASSDAATVNLVNERLLPCLRRLCRGKSSAGIKLTAAGSNEDADTMDLDSQDNAAAGAAPKAAKWAGYALAGCQDGSSSRRELEALADELATQLESGAADTAAKLQALAAVGRLVPGAYGRHVEQLRNFVLNDYLLSYLDAAATAPASTSARSPGLKSPASDSSKSPQQLGSSGSGSQPETAAVLLKAAAVKALAAGCVPDSDSSDVPVETLRVVARLAQDLEGLLDPAEDNQPQFLEDAPPEACGQLRLTAASALLRLARRHDSRLGPSCYCMLALVMQDNLEEVRAAFAAKVYKLIKFFQHRPSTHQLAAKYAAMLPLAAMDPSKKNKDDAARKLREWVHGRRAAVQQLITAAAAAGNGGAGGRGGGSTLQELPEMVLPYGLYILAHHPDFPQGDDVEELAAYEPFQYMLQFMLQPLLVASGSEPAGASIPALLKMCRSLKRTTDTADEPANTQLYVLCDMAAATIKSLAQQMGLDVSGMLDYPGSVILPKGLYKPLDKADKGIAGTSYLPLDFEVVFDPDPAAGLAQPHQQQSAWVAGGRSSRSRAGHTTGAAPAAGRGSKRQAAAMQSEEAGGNGPGSARAKRRTGGGCGGHTGGRKAAAVRGESNDGWESDEDYELEPAAQLTKRQQKLQQQQPQNQAAAAAGTSEDGGSDASEGEENHEPAAAKQQRQQGTGSAGERSVGKRARQQQHLEADLAPTSAGEAAGQPAAKRNRSSAPKIAAVTAKGQLTQQQWHQQNDSGKGQQLHGKAQQASEQQGRLKQQSLTFAAAQPADASSPAPASRSRYRTAATINTTAAFAANGDAGISESEGVGESEGGAEAASNAANGTPGSTGRREWSLNSRDTAGASPHKSPAGKRQQQRRQQQRQHNRVPDDDEPAAEAAAAAGKSVKRERAAGRATSGRVSAKAAAGRKNNDNAQQDQAAAPTKAAAGKGGRDGGRKLVGEKTAAAGVSDSSRALNGKRAATGAKHPAAADCGEARKTRTRAA
eukprot:GHRR01016403.1.p1 GENE.GHRR01016403.1~~GHRR01016403.1.p1  ORF type:complete len:1542 (+),score=797.44 GHRR01016403.1:616-5241(+)